MHVIVSNVIFFFFLKKNKLYCIFKVKRRLTHFVMTLALFTESNLGESFPLAQIIFGLEGAKWGWVRDK